MIYKTLLGEEIDMEVEVWKPVIRYSKNRKGKQVICTNIEVSNFGNVRGEKWHHKKFNDEMIVVIEDRKFIKNHGNPIYRLVWEAFNGPVSEGYVVHHIDENKLNDRLDNFELMTRSKHSTYHGKNQSLEQREKHSKAMKGRIPWNKNGKLDDTTKEKISYSLFGNKNAEGHCLTYECKKKISDNKKSKHSHWYTNGVENVLINEFDEIPNGYVKGRTMPWNEKNIKYLTMFRIF